MECLPYRNRRWRKGPNYSLLRKRSANVSQEELRSERENEKAMKEIVIETTAKYQLRRKSPKKKKKKRRDITEFL